MVKFEESMLSAELDYEWARQNMSEEDFRKYYHGRRANISPNVRGEQITHFEKGKWYRADISKIHPIDIHNLKSEYKRSPDFFAVFDGKAHLCIDACSSISNMFLAKFDTSSNVNMGDQLYSYARAVSCWEEL